MTHDAHSTRNHGRALLLLALPAAASAARSDCWPAGSRTVRVTDLRTGKVVREAVAWAADDWVIADPQDYPQPDLRALRLSKTGRAEWISDFVGEREVWRLDSRGARRLDSGRKGVTSLAITSSRVSSVNEGARKSASFR